MVSPPRGALACRSAARFCTLTSPEGIVRKPVIQDRSHDDLFAQVKRHGICEPCSRLSTAGSIAARSTADSDDRPRTQRVLPPLNGGLHCGVVSCSDCDRAMAGAPASQRRAPLRRLPCPAPPGGACPCSRLSTAGSIAARHGRVLAAWVLPPLNGGLHCGGYWLPVCRGRAQVLPPLNGGLHCGIASDRRPRLRSAVLPPLNGGLHCGRSWSAGNAVHHAGAPASQRRAPLRLIVAARSLASVMVAGAPASQRRAPLRPGGVAAMCAYRCSRLSTAGSIAALPAGAVATPRWCSRLSTAGSIAAWPSDDVPTNRPVLPPLNGGLHCGARLPRHHVRRPGVLPPFNGGLHCGPPSGWRGNLAPGAPAFQRRAPLRPTPREVHVEPVRAPAFQRRAPLRPRPGVDRLARLRACSRLSTAGSIAA